MRSQRLFYIIKTYLGKFFLANIMGNLTHRIFKKNNVNSWLITPELLLLLLLLFWIKAVFVHRCLKAQQGLLMGYTNASRGETWSWLVFI